MVETVMPTSVGQRKSNRASRAYSTILPQAMCSPCSALFREGTSGARHRGRDESGAAVLRPRSEMIYADLRIETPVLRAHQQHRHRNTDGLESFTPLRYSRKFCCRTECAYDIPITLLTVESRHQEFALVGS